MAGGAGPGDTYSVGVAFIYVFNLIVGTGVLALPAVLISGGWVLGSTFVLLVAFLSYVSATFMIEAMAAANAVLVLRNKMASGENVPLVTDMPRDVFNMTQKTEIGQIAGIFFGQSGRVAFYFALIVYLFGDAAIYCTFVPKSLVNFVYGGSTAPDWAFYLYLFLFLAFVVPFCFFDFARIRLLQVPTMAVRQAALFTILVLSVRILVKHGPNVDKVPDFKVSAVPNLFGGAVYAFMCHHSLPGIIHPLENKAHALRIITVAFAVISMIYLALFYSCGLAFGTDAKDPITFNFPPQEYGWIGDGLLLFPVFTLTSNFPILCITLRNNLSTLIDLIQAPQLTLPLSPKRISSGDVAPTVDRMNNYEFSPRRRALLTMLTVLPPVAFCIAAQHFEVDVNTLVGFTGAFAGCAVMFIIPACLVHASRKVLPQLLVAAFPPERAEYSGLSFANKHASPFRSTWWVAAIIAWAVLAMIFNFFEEFAKVEKL